MNILNIEAQARIALLGGGYDWRSTQIIETEAARSTCPFRHAGKLPDGWWRRAEPRDGAGREVIVIKTIDGAKQKNQVAAAADELEPREDEPVNLWLARVATRGGTEDPFWKALHSYAQRFPQTASARRTLDRQVVSSFLKNLKGTARSKQ